MAVEEMVMDEGLLEWNSQADEVDDIGMVEERVAADYNKLTLLVAAVPMSMVVKELFGVQEGKQLRFFFLRWHWPTMD